MKQKALMILALLCMVAQGVWADDEPAPNKAEEITLEPNYTNGSRFILSIPKE